MSTDQTAPARTLATEAGRVAGGDVLPSRRPRPARQLTPEELSKVVELSRAGVVVRIPPDPPTGLDCACDGRGGVCLAHAKAKPERVKVRAVPWLPVEV